MRVKIHYNRLKLKTKFSISHGTYTFRDSFVVELIENGVSGFGETVVIDYYNIERDSLFNALKKLQACLEAWDVSLTCQAFYELISNEESNAFVLCAYDCAYWDLKARLENKSLRSYLGVPSAICPVSSITIGTNEDEGSINNKLEQDWPLIKLKAHQQVDFDMLERIRSKGKQVGIDANGSFSAKYVESIEEQLTLYHVQYIEEPFSLKQETLNLKRTSIPILADESCIGPDSILELKDQVDGYVLKLTKLGGITPTVQCVKSAKLLGKKLLAGCMTESTVGISAMSAMLPWFDYADLDGAFLISNDPATGSKLLENGILQHPDLHIFGTGAKLKQGLRS